MSSPWLGDWPVEYDLALIRVDSYNPYEGFHEDSDLLLRGRLATQAPDIDGGVIINDGTAPAGTFVTCEVTEAHPYDLVARIV